MTQRWWLQPARCYLPQARAYTCSRLQRNLQQQRHPCLIAANPLRADWSCRMHDDVQEHLPPPLQRLVSRLGWQDKLLTAEQLAQYKSDNPAGGGKIYMAILGEVFDVSAKQQFYGEGAWAMAHTKAAPSADELCLWWVAVGTC